MASLIKRTTLFLFPPVYCVLGILAPIYLLDTHYGVSTLLFFWVPSVFLYLHLRSWMPREYHLAFWACSVCIAIVTFGFEYVALALDIWNFTEHIHSLWGIEWAGVPIEEFVFWFGATPFCLGIYLYYVRFFQEGVDARSSY